MLEIGWADGVRSRYPLGFLRKNCPCAMCRTEREKQAATLLPILTSVPAGEVSVTGGGMVGNYAIQLTWSDGHNSGIFDFRYLRSLHERLPGHPPHTGTS
jgi:DUF971 family protein